MLCYLYALSDVFACFCNFKHFPEPAKFKSNQAEFISSLTSYTQTQENAHLELKITNDPSLIETRKTTLKTNMFLPERPETTKRDSMETACL